VEPEPLASFFAPSVWRSYVESPLPPPMITHLNAPQARGGQVRELDVRRRRRNALFHAQRLPRFCVYDDIVERTEHKLGVLNYIDVGALTWTQTELAAAALLRPGLVRPPSGGISAAPRCVRLGPREVDADCHGGRQLRRGARRPD